MTFPTFALAGNPNSGKTTLFNSFTGARQHVGNYPGVTVEKKEGRYVHNGKTFNIVDLPGTYSLTAYSLEEVVARDYLVNEKPAAVINIVDASNLERNLYLTVQFMELGAPIILALNMMDVAESRGITIDTEKLGNLLGVPVVATVARRGQGREELGEVADRIVGDRAPAADLAISYGKDVDEALADMTEVVTDASFMTDVYPAKWVALKYLEKDEQILTRGRQTDDAISQQLETRVAVVEKHLQATVNSTPEFVIADQRYGFIRSILKQGVVREKTSQDRLYMSDRIDRVLTNQFAGPLIMLAVIWGLYEFTFTYSEVPVGWFEAFFWLAGGHRRYGPAGRIGEVDDRFRCHRRGRRGPGLRAVDHVHVSGHRVFR
jgi:ferrous iron transport protein B